MSLTVRRSYLLTILWSCLMTVGTAVVSFYFSNGSGLRAMLFGSLAAVLNVPVILWFHKRAAAALRREFPVWGCPACQGTAIHAPGCPRRSDPLPPDPLPLPLVDDRSL